MKVRHLAVGKEVLFIESLKSHERTGKMLSRLQRKHKLI